MVAINLKELTSAIEKGLELFQKAGVLGTGAKMHLSVSEAYNYSLELPLDARQRGWIEKHLEECEYCTERIARLRASFQDPIQPSRGSSFFEYDEANDLVQRWIAEIEAEEHDPGTPSPLGNFFIALSENPTYYLSSFQPERKLPVTMSRRSVMLGEQETTPHVLDEIRADNNIAILKGTDFSPGKRCSFLSPNQALPPIVTTILDRARIQQMYALVLIVSKSGKVTVWESQTHELNPSVGFRFPVPTDTAEVVLVISPDRSLLNCIEKQFSEEGCARNDLDLSSTFCVRYVSGS